MSRAVRLFLGSVDCGVDLASVDVPSRRQSWRDVVVHFDSNLYARSRLEAAPAGTPPLSECFDQTLVPQTLQRDADGGIGHAW